MISLSEAVLKHGSIVGIVHVMGLCVDIEVVSRGANLTCELFSTIILNVFVLIKGLNNMQ